MIYVEHNRVSLIRITYIITSNMAGKNKVVFDCIDARYHCCLILYDKHAFVIFIVGTYKMMMWKIDIC